MTPFTFCKEEGFDTYKVKEEPTEFHKEKFDMKKGFPTSTLVVEEPEPMIIERNNKRKDDFLANQTIQEKRAKTTTPFY